MRRRIGWILAGIATLGLCAAGWVCVTWPEPAPPADWSDEYNTSPTPQSDASGSEEYDLVARPPQQLPAGIVLGRTAPQGWSHLVIKSHPHVREDHKAGLPSLTVEKAGWMFTAFVADVVPKEHAGRKRYRYRATALGLGANVDGRDTILTPEASENLGWIGREILTKGYEVQRKSMVVLAGPSMALVDTPVWFRCGTENKLVRYRYALLVDAATGRLNTLLWRLGVENGWCGDSDRAVWLAPDTIDPAALVVDRRKVNRIGLPSDDAFAVEAMPPARATVAIPPDLRPLAVQKRFTAADAATLDRELRKLLTP